MYQSYIYQLLNRNNHVTNYHKYLGIITKLPIVVNNKSQGIIAHFYKWWCVRVSIEKHKTAQVNH